jgi:hypothetical protein
MLADPALRTSLSDAGRTRALAFSWENTVAATRAVYAEALGD